MKVDLCLFLLLDEMLKGVFVLCQMNEERPQDFGRSLKVTYLLIVHFDLLFKLLGSFEPVNYRHVYVKEQQGDRLLCRICLPIIELANF